MTLEDKVNQLESRLNNLQNAFLQSQKNQVPVTAKTDETASKVVEITPWSETKTAYIDDTEITFTGVPQGNVNAFVGGVNYANFERLDDRIIVKFEPLAEAKEVIINVI